MPLFTEPMRKFELVVMKTDVDSVMRYLGFAGCVQLAADGQSQHDLTEEERELADLKTRLVAVARFLGIDDAPVASRDTPSRASLRERALALVESTKNLLDEETALVQRRLALRQTAEELAEFSSVSVSFSDLEGLDWLTYRVGSVDAADVETLAGRLQKRAAILPLRTPGHILTVAPKKGRWALDTELKRFDFQEGHLPEGAKGKPAEMLAAVNRELSDVDAGLATIDERKRAERERIGGELQSLLFHLDLDTTIDAVKQGFAATGSVQRVSGWVPARRFGEISGGLDELTRGRLALSAQEPEEIPEVKTGKTKVPVSTPHGALTRAFDRMVLSYSVPAYGTIDPTAFVAVIFVVLFGIMFGDVGQGLVGLIIGILINSGRVKSFETYRRKSFGTTFILAGAAAMISGLLYGSVFANEAVLEPFTRWWTGALLGHPLDRVIALGGFQKILMFFGVTIGIGALINTAGIVINIVNNVRRRDWEQTFLTKTGLAGALFFWYFLFIGVRILTGGGLGTVDFVALAVPLLALVLREPLVRIAKHEKPVLKDGAFAFVMEGIVEVLETAIYYISNSVSFLRVAAFGLAHTVLSSIIFLLAGMVGGGSLGLFWQILVVLIGNTIIIVLEGLIVTIQVVRLQYYEFFSKFFNDSGEQFSPFILGASGGLR